MKRLPAKLAALICVVSCATLGTVEIWPVLRDVQTTDQNGDGRPDLWRHYNARGQVIRVDVDTNFDGKADIEEYYERGVLVRRESDRNFNGQADLVEEFDAATHVETRSVIDIDYDGVADLLVLFRDGRPVFARLTHAKSPDRPPVPVVFQRDASRLVALVDPFQAETALGAAYPLSQDQQCVGLSTSGGLPSPHFVMLGRLSPSIRVVAQDVLAPTPARLLPRSPRAPPIV